MKKVISIILVVVMLCSTFAGLQITSVAADLPSSGSCGENVTYTFDSATGLLTISGSGAMYYSSNNPFYNQTGIITVVIESGVTSIGYYAFYGCSGLTSITIPDSVTSIGERAFSGCSSLTNITIPDSFTYIGSEAFSGCSGLTSITIPNSVTSICEYAFSGCSNLKKVNISSIESWCKIRFSDYDASSNPLYYAHNLYLNGELLTDLVIPNSVTSIGNSAFFGCSGLTSITIPDSVTSIGNEAFYGCSSLTSITIPDSVTYIGYGAFDDCSGLKELTMPASVNVDVDMDGATAYSAFGCSNIETITLTKGTGKMINYLFAEGAFCDYAHTPWYISRKNLKEIVIEDGVENIGSFAFCGCSGLTSITIPNSVTSIGDYAFSGCSGLTSITIPDSVTSIGESVFSGCSGLTSITIPDSVTSIGNEAFYGCSGLTGITIPDSVSSIGWRAFDGCTGLRRVDISDMHAWCSISFADRESNPLSIVHKLYLNGEEVTHVDVPAGLERINDYAFYSCESLENVVFPDSVTSIGIQAFRHCKNLKSVVLPASVKEVGQEAFWYCPRLETITVQNMDCAFGPQAVSFGTKMIAPLDSTAYEFARNYNMEFIELGSEISGEHRWDAGVVTKPASCLQTGEITYTCLDCAQTKTKVLAKTGHHYQSKAVAPNCIAQGFTVYTCPDCGDCFRTDYVAATDTHDYKAVTTTPATCSQAGVKTFTCTVCGDKYTETIPMKAHTVVSDSAVAPTCTKYGLSAGKYCSVCGKVFETQEKIEPLGHDFGSVVTPATLTANGIIKHPCSRCDKADESEVIYAPKTFALAKTKYVYSGKKIAPAVTVKDSKGKALVKGTDYTVAYKNNKNIGTARVAITFKGNYKGTKTLAFTIVPKATNLALAGAKKAFTAKWTKIAGITGYQIQYATNAKFTGAKAVTVKGAAKYAQAIKNLKGGAKYYVRIRTYKTVGGKNYFSAWSAAKAVTTKR